MARIKEFWQPLVPGDTVDIIAPAFGTSRGDVTAAVQFLKKWGLKAIVPKDLFGPHYLCSNKDSIRVKHIKRALSSKSKAIWCIRGGYGSARIFDEVTKLKKPKLTKAFIGYSDVTILHHYFNHFWGWPTIHGPLLDRLGTGGGTAREVLDLHKLLFGYTHEIRYRNLKPLNSLAKKKSVIQSSMSGGNLVLMQTLMGTPWQRDAKGKILVFEDVGERGYQVDRMLFHLKYAGFFKGVKAVIFGDFVGGNELNGKMLWKNVIQEFSKKAPFPVLKGLHVGHGKMQRPLPLNTRSKLILGSKPELYVNAGSLK